MFDIPGFSTKGTLIPVYMHGITYLEKFNSKLKCTLFICNLHVNIPWKRIQFQRPFFCSLTNVACTLMTCTAVQKINTITNLFHNEVSSVGSHSAGTDHCTPPGHVCWHLGVGKQQFLNQCNVLPVYWIIGVRKQQFLSQCNVLPVYWITDVRKHSSSISTML